MAEIDGCLIGMAQVTVKGDIADFDKLFVEPTPTRRGSIDAWGRLTMGSPRLAPYRDDSSRG
ncbi:MAG: hypothetical protein EXQ87_04760 [Alphaproteobacteria bacterium]|nr:hypothetical protein [Alphaproteobacteria bacterium]